MDTQLQALLDKQAITDLVNAYCVAADRHDYDKMRSLYHPDATDDHGGFFNGLAMEFIEQLPAIQEPMIILHHNLTTVNIAIEGNYGEGEIYVLAFHQVATDGGPLDLIIGGRYFDRYEKRAGEWKFSARAVVADWANVNTPSTVQLDHPLVAGSYIGTPGEDDPSYSFFRLLKRGQ